MFVYSVKTSKAKMIIIAAVIVAAAGILVFFGSRGRGAETAQDGAISYKAEDSPSGSHSFRNSAGGSPRTPQRSAKSSSRRNSTRATRNTPK